MRIDEFLFAKGFFDSRTKAKQAIESGSVFYRDKVVLKPSTEVFDIVLDAIKISDEERFVSLGGYKLAKALKDFDFNVDGLIVADIGASTGGFTDCLIKNGAKKVYAIDLNDDLLHDSLKRNGKVTRVIKNAKNLVAADVSGIDLITADLSFISAKQVLSVFYDILPENGRVILLIKPQFEIGTKRRFKNGIVKDLSTHKTVCRSVYDEAIRVGFSVIDMTVAPIKEDKNTEFLILLLKNGASSVDFEKLYKF